MVRQAPPFSIQVKRVCATCNNGWMNDLETAARPLLEPMIVGRGRALHRDGQRTIATWAMKTMLMFEFAYPEQLIPRELYEHLYAHREPPPRTRAWLAPYGGERFSTYYKRHALGLTFGPGSTYGIDHPNMYGATLQVGDLAVQIYVPTFEEDVVLSHAKWLPLYPLWPSPGSITFMPRPALDDAGLELFVDAFDQ
jgi:hypothetical protein